MMMMMMIDEGANMPEEVELQLSESNMKADSRALIWKRHLSDRCLGRSLSSSWQRCPKNASPNLTPVNSSVFYSPPSDLYYQASAELLAADPASVVNKEKQKDGSEEDEIDSVKDALRLCGHKPELEKSTMAEQGREEHEIDSVSASNSRGYTPKSEKSTMAKQGRQKDELDRVKASFRRYMTKSETSRMGEEEEEIDTAKAPLRGCMRKSQSLLSITNSRNRTSAYRKETERFLRIHHQKPQTQQKTERVGAVEQLRRTEQQDSRYTRSDYRAFEDSDIESLIRSFLPSQARAGDSPMAAVERNEKEAKLLAWKEAAMLKLMNRLKKKEAEVSYWEHKKTLKYKTEMKHFEKKMQEKRVKAYLKMEQKLRKTEEKAEEKKVKETEKVARKISKTSKAVDRISRGGKLHMLC